MVTDDFTRAADVSAKILSLSFAELNGPRKSLWCLGDSVFHKCIVEQEINQVLFSCMEVNFTHFTHKC